MLWWRRARDMRSWSKATAYNRGQVIYRLAEMLEGRKAGVRRADHDQYGRLDQDGHS